jgi:hypothetical protein
MSGFCAPRADVLNAGSGRPHLSLVDFGRSGDREGRPGFLGLRKPGAAICGPPECYLIAEMDAGLLVVRVKAA